MKFQLRVTLVLCLCVVLLATAQGKANAKAKAKGNTTDKEKSKSTESGETTKSKSKTSSASSEDSASLIAAGCTVETRISDETSIYGCPIFTEGPGLLESRCTGWCASSSLMIPSWNQQKYASDCQCCKPFNFTEDTVSLACPERPVTLTVTCDNALTKVFIDGVEETTAVDPVALGDWTKSSTFSMTGGVSHVIAFECEDRGGMAGLLASTSDGALMTDDVDWKCSQTFEAGWEAPSFDTTNWSAASIFGVNGDRPWGVRPGIDLNAQWIWTSDNNQDNLVYCRGVYNPPPPTPVGDATMMTATCDNQMKVYFDGVLQTGLPQTDLDNWRVTTQIAVPPGTVMVGIECYDEHVVAGILASFDNGLVTDGSWSCSDTEVPGWSDPSVDPGFQPASVYGTNGVGPWGNLAGIDPSSQWIWTADNNYDTSTEHTAYCRFNLITGQGGNVDFTYKVIDTCECGSCGDTQQGPSWEPDYEEN